MLIVVGLYVRMRLSESPEFEMVRAEGRVVKNPFLTVLRQDWRNILRVIALRVVESCAYYLTATYLLSYITKRNEDDRIIGLTGVVIASIIAVGTTLYAGRLTDRVGRRRVYLVGCLLAIAFGIPMYLMANTGQPFFIVLLFIIGIGLIHAMLTGTQGAWFAELFRTSTRTSGASIGYQVAASIAGFAPFLAVLLAERYGWIGPALFYVTVGLVGLGGVIATKETWGPKQREEVDALIRGDADPTVRRGCAGIGGMQPGCGRSIETSSALPRQCGRSWSTPARGLSGDRLSPGAELDGDARLSAGVCDRPAADRPEGHASRRPPRSRRSRRA